MMRKKWLWLTVLVIAVGGLMAVNVMRLSATVTVTTAIAEKGVISESVYSNGRLQPAEERSVYTEISGKIAEVHVREGDRVQAGDKLITYDTEDWQLQLEEARNQVEIAKLQRETERKRNFELVRGQQDAAEVEKVRDAEEHAQRLHELQLASTERSIERLERLVQENSLAAPADGMITSVAVQAGATVPAGYEAVQIVNVSRLLVEAALNELDAGKVQLGMEAVVTGDAFEEQFTGKLKYIAPMARPAGMDGMDYEVPIQVELDAGGAGSAVLKPGFAATLEFKLAGEERVLVPLSAVKYAGADAYVYRIADGEAVRAYVTVGKDDGERIEILSGLDAGDEIIYPVPDGLREGDQVKAETEA